MAMGSQAAGQVRTVQSLAQALDLYQLIPERSEARHLI